MALPVLMISLVALLFLLPIFVLRLRKGSVASKQNPLPPSPPGIPIVGNLHQLGSLPHRSLYALSEKHGPLMLLRMGNVPTLVVSSADAAREIMKNHDLTFASRPSSKVAQVLFQGSQDLAFEPYGEYWRQARKVCITHLLSTKMVQSFRRMREEEVALMIDKISSSSTTGVVNMSEILFSFSNDILCRIVSGKSSMEGRRNTIFHHLMEENAALFGAFHVEDYIPYLGWLDVFFGLNARAKRCSKRWDDVLEQVIKDHANRTGGDGIEDVHFVDVLLSLQNDPYMDFHLTTGNIKALLMDMFSAGTETSYILLEWAMVELVRNPEAMKTLQEEVRGIVRGKAMIQEEDLHEMRYLKIVMKEVLRLHPPAPLLLPRESMEDCKIHGYTIPNKTRVIINAWTISRDPKSWESPDEFQPMRFMDSSIDFKGNDFQLIPFGAGRRICPGINFAMTTAELALANLVRQFEWELPDGIARANLDMTEASGLLVRRKQKLDLLVKSYF